MSDWRPTGRMPCSSSHSAFVSFLKIQPGLNLLFLLYLSIVGLYTVYSLSRAILQLRAVRNAATTPAMSAHDAALKRIDVRLSNLRQFHQFSFFLFLALFAGQVYIASATFAPYKVPGWFAVAGYVSSDAQYAFVVFVTFVALHSLQWLASARLNSFLRKQQA